MTYQPLEKINCVVCGKPSVARRLCKSCYYKHRRNGVLNEFRKLAPDDVFWGRVKKTKTCWLWTGTKNYYGYGIFLLPGEKQVRAHRYAYEKTKGKIPKGKVILHKCDNPICVNPDHLSAGTRLQNNRDAVNKSRNAFGEKNGHSKLTMEQTEAIKKDNRKQFLIAKDYGVNQSQISRIKAGIRRSKG